MILEGIVYKVITLEDLRREANTLKINENGQYSKERNSSIKHFKDSNIDSNSPDLMANVQATRRNQGDFRIIHTTWNKEFRTQRTKGNDDPKILGRLNSLSLSDNTGLNSTRDHALRDTKIVKSFKSILMGSKMHSGFKLLLFAICINIIFMVTLSTITSSQTVFSLNQVSKGVNVINIATSRLSYVIKVWGFALFLYSQSIGLIQFSDLYVKLFTEFIYYDAVLLVEWNKQLKDSLSYMTEVDFLAEAFSNNIRLWGLAEDKYHNYTETNMFIAHDILISKYMAMSAVTNLSEYAEIEDIAYTLNNTANDFMLSNQRVIQKTEAFLTRTFSKSTFVLKLLLTMKTVCFLVFFFLFCLIILVLLRSYKSLFKALIRIDEEVIAFRIFQLNKVKSVLEMDIEADLFMHNASDFFIDNKQSVKHTDEKAKNKAFKSRKLILRKMVIHFSKIAAIALIFTPVFAAINGNELLGFLARLKDFDRMSNQVSVFNEACYQADLLSSSFFYVAAFLDEGNMLLYNGNPFVKMKVALNDIKEQPAKLAGLFYNSQENDLDPLIEDILKNKVCAYLDETYRPDCANATSNMNNGLLSVIAQLSSYSADYFAQLERARNLYEPGSSMDIFKDIVEGLTYYTGPDLIVTKNAFPVIIDYLMAKFNSLIAWNLERQNKVSIVAYVLTVVFSIFIYFVPIRIFKKSDLNRRKILRVVPIHILHENKFLFYYILGDFKDEARKLKSIV